MPTLRVTMREEIRRLQQQLGVATLFVTHDQTEALSMSDRIAVMREGVIVQEGAPRDIYSLPANAYVAGFLGRINFVEGHVVELGTGNQVTVRVGDAVVRCRSAVSLHPGELVSVAVRPENIVLTAADREDRGVIGVVTSLSFLGDSIDYTVEFQGRPVIVSARSNVVFAPGDVVRMELDESTTAVFEGSATAAEHEAEAANPVEDTAVEDEVVVAG